MFDDVLVPAGAGIAAGLGVAMPLGAIAALLLREGLVNGFRVAAAGASGVAVVDTVYCAIATTTGALFAPLVEGHTTLFLLISGSLIVIIGIRQLLLSLRRRSTEAADVEVATPWATFVRFVGLTAINPLTLLYFVALAGAVTTRSGTWVGPVVFVIAAGLSSWCWQLLLAALGSASGRGFGPTATEAIGILASLIIVVLGGAIMASALRA